MVVERDLEQESGPVELPEGYYAENFAAILRTVQTRYDDLLTAAEREFAQTFLERLSLGARRLYVRLASRKGPIFRRDRLDYPEIAELDDAAHELESAGLLDRAEEAEIGELLALLLRSEAEAMLRELGGEVPAGALKAEVLETLAERIEADELRESLEERLGLLRPLGAEEVEVFRLLFFGNLHQDWTEFVLRDLGVVCYETYDLRRELRLFNERQAIDDTRLLRAARNAIGRHLAEGEAEPAFALAEEVLAGAGAWHASARRWADQVLVRTGRERERRGEWAEALRLYAAAERPPARERRARVLDRLERFAEALELCREIESSPRDEGEAEFAPRFAHGVRRRAGEKLPPRRRPKRRVEELDLELGGGGPVEALALEALAERGRVGIFAENWLWKSLFGLAFWDVIFAPVPGAFEHPFQLGPLDLHGPDFRRARRGMIADRLSELEAEEDLAPRLLEVYRAKSGTANALVSWHEGSLAALEFALERIEGRHLAVVCDRLSRDLRRYRRGLPDLFVARDEPPGFELLEVKAPGDQLRPEQGAWIDHLEARGIPAAVLKLREI